MAAAKKPRKKTFLQQVKAKGGAGAWTLDTAEFNKMLVQLQDQFKPPLTAIEVMNSEALSILQGAARKTKRTNINKIKARYNPSNAKFIPFVRLNGKLVSTRVLKAGAGRDKVSGRFIKAQDLSSHNSRVKKRLDFYKKRAFDRVGLSKAIFYATAKDSLKLPGYGRNWGADSKYIKKAYLVQKRAGKGRGAPAARGKGPKHGGASKAWQQSQTGSAKQEPEGYLIKFQIETANTLNPFTKGVAAAQSAINGRVGLFRKGMKKGFFDDLKFVAKNYPNVRVS